MTAESALWIGLVAVLALGSLHWVGGIVVDDAFVESWLSRMIDSETGRHEVSVGAVAVRPLRTGIRITSLRIAPRSGGRGVAVPAPVGPGLRLHVPELEIDGIDLFSTLGGSLAAREVRAAGVNVVHQAGTRGWNQIVTQLGLELHDLVLDGPAGTGLLASLLGALAEARADLYLIRGSDGRRSVELREVVVSPATATARTERATLWMTRDEVSDSDPWPGGGRVATDTTRISASGTRVRELTLDTVDGTIAVSGRSLVVDSLAALVVDAVPPGPHREAREPAAKTPQQHLRSVGVPARIDSVAVEGGWIRYRELRPGHRLAGEILFDELSGSVAPLVAGPPGPRVPDTVRVSTRSHLQSSAPVRLDVGFPAAGEDFTFTAEGSVDDLPLTSLNPMFGPVAGVRIRGGWLGELTFRLAVNGGRARGTVRPVFDDLDLSLENTSSGGRGIAEHIRGFVMSLRLNSDNLPAEGDGFRHGTIDRSVPRDETFLQALWYSLRQGLRDVAGI
ncbi:MAG: hypothetical protein ACOC83_09160 [Gemmatimonadota bacterium]